MRILLACLLCISTCTSALQQQPMNVVGRNVNHDSINDNKGYNDFSPQRRAIFEQARTSILAALLVGGATASIFPEAADAKINNGITLTTSPSGLRWADPKVGTGQPVKNGSPVSIDYSMASTAGRFPQIYTTKDTGSPYRWTLGDGSTIKGIELAVLGSDSEGIPPMKPGGIRRVIIPEALGFQELAKPNAKCIDGEAGSIGPIPPKENIAGSGAYQRWYQFYCNPRIPYQPDLVLDIKLYGKR